MKKQLDFVLFIETKMKVDVISEIYIAFKF